MNLLHNYNMVDDKPVTTPMASSPKLTLTTCTSLFDPTIYRKLVGSLQYLAFTRLDIAYAVNRLSQFMHRLTEDHWQGAKRILRYLAGTSTHGIFFSAKNPLTLHAFSDSDWEETHMITSPPMHISSILVTSYLLVYKETKWSCKIIHKNRIQSGCKHSIKYSLDL